MADHNAHVLLVRALNHLKKLHLPSYLGLRGFLENAVAKEHPELIFESIIRKKDLLSPYHYYGFYSLKRVGKDRNSYRHMTSLSPLAILAETYLLSVIAKQPVFAVADCVYSNRWPSDSSGNIYHFYLDSYFERNSAIKFQLRNKPDSIAHVFDIEDYYPSVNLKILFRNLSKAIEKSSISGEEKELLGRIIETYKSKKGKGIPIGTPFSDFLGNFYLNDLDAVMNEKYPGRYFRYVDDLIVVEESSQHEQIRETIETHISGLSLRLNKKKVYTAKREEWSNLVPEKVAKTADDYWTVSQRLIAYCGRNQDDLYKIKEHFNANFPYFHAERIFNALKYARFGKYFTKLLAELRTLGLREYIRSLTDSLEDISTAFFAVKKKYESEFIDLLKIHLDSDMKGKYIPQRLNFLLNRLIPLATPEDIEIYERLTRDKPEMLLKNRLLNALQTRNPELIRDYPATTPLMYCTYMGWQAITKRKIQAEKVEREPLYEFESLLIFSIFGYGIKIKGATKNIKALLSFCQQKYDEGKPYSYDFVEYLRASIWKTESGLFKKFLQTRFSDEEDYLFELEGLPTDYGELGYD